MEKNRTLANHHLYHLRMKLNDAKTEIERIDKQKDITDEDILHYGMMVDLKNELEIRINEAKTVFWKLGILAKEKGEIC